MNRKLNMIRPEDFYFGVSDTAVGPRLVVCPKDFWRRNKWFSIAVDNLDSLLPKSVKLEDWVEEHEWMVQDGKVEQVATDMESAGFERCKEMEQLLRELNEDEYHES